MTGRPLAAALPAMHAVLGRFGQAWVRMSKPVRWGLVTTVLAAVAVSWLPEQESGGSTRARPVAAPTGTASPIDRIHAAAGVQDAWLNLLKTPASLQRNAAQDPFVPKASVVQPVPVAAAPTPSLSPAEVFVGPPERPPPPPPPVPQVRVVGWLLAADGKLRVLLADNQAEVLAEVGLQLSDGFVVQALDRSAIQLLHPPTRTRFALPLPPSAAETLSRR